MNANIVAAFVANTLDKRPIEGGYEAVADHPVGGDESLVQLTFMGRRYLLKVVDETTWIDITAPRAVRSEDPDEETIA